MSEFLTEKGKMDEYGYGEDRFDDRLPYSFGYQQNLQKKTNPEKKSTRDKLDRLCTDVNYDLAISKSFYFFFLAAYGSVFPLIAVYFKQLGMSATQTGLLIGFRPFVEMVAGPFWGNVAERWKKWKTILLFSIFCWVAFTLSLAFVQPPAHACLVHNGTDVFLARPFTVSGLTFSDLVDRNKVGAQRRDVGFGQTGSRSKRHLLQEEDTSDGYDDGASDAVDTTELGAVQFKVEVHPNFEDNSEPNENQEPGNIGDISENRDGLGTDEGGVDDEEQPTSLNSEEPGRFEEEGNQHHYYGAAEENEENETPASEDDNNGGATEEDVDEDEEATSELMLPTMSTSLVTLFEEVTGLARGVTPAYRFQQLYQFRKFPYPTADRLGISPLPLDYLHVVNVDEQGTRGLVSPPLSAVVYRTQDIQSIFLIILMLQIVGEFLSAPAIPMADTATLGYLGDELGSSYGRQRMFGSIGWAVAMFFVGIALDHSNIFPNHPCGSEQLVDRNYMTCYAVFSVLMCCALLSATQFRFKEEDSPFQTIQLAEMKDRVIDKVQDKLTKRKKQDRDSLIEMDEDDEAMRLRIMTAARQDANARMTLQQPQHPQTNMVSDTSAESCPYVPRGKPGQAGTLPQWMEVLKMFLPIQYSSMVFVLWFMGFGVGLMFAFLFWHLQDLKGTPTLFGIASVFNHVSEIVAYFFIQNIVLKIGHVNVIYAGLIGNVVRFIYVSYLENPWWILPFEFLQGLTHAGVWAVGCSYVTQAVPVKVRPTAQFILQSLHQTVGRGCGTIIGGAIISQYGTEAVFRGYGIVCIFVLVGYFALNFFYIRKLVPAAEAAIGPTAVSSAAESSYLAPHGALGEMSGEKQSINRYEKGDGTSGVYGMYGANMDHPYPLNGFLDSAAADTRSYSYQQYGFEGASKDICNDPDYQYGHEIDVNDFKTAADLISSKHLQNIAAYKPSNARNDSNRTSQRSNEDDFRGNDMEFQIARRLATQPDSTPRTETVQEQPPNRDFPRVSPARNPAYQQNCNWLY